MFNLFALRSQLCRLRGMARYRFDFLQLRTARGPRAMTKKSDDNLQPAPIRILNIKEVCHRVGIARATVYRWKAAGLFPEPVKLGVNRIGWRDNVIQEWIENLSDDGDGPCVVD